MKSRTLFVMTLVAVALIAGSVHARVIGYTEDTENFPNMLETDESCSKAYEDFLSVAQPLNACRHLEEAKSNLAAQQSLKEDMGAIQKCRDCKKMMVQADEDAQAYKEQIKLYKARCPSADKQANLENKIKGKTKVVCSSCKNKWPGTLGPNGSTPCR